MAKKRLTLKSTDTGLNWNFHDQKKNAQTSEKENQKMEASEIQELAEITVKVDKSRIAEFQKLAEEFGVQHISIKADFGASTPKNPKVEFGTPPKSPNVDFGTHFMMPNTDLEPPTPNSSNDIDGNISKSADGAICTCNVCGKILSCMSSARRHFKTTHEVHIVNLFLMIFVSIQIKNT